MKTPYDTLILELTKVPCPINPTLLQALVCQESAGNPWASRFEPGYWTNAVVDREAGEWAKRHGGIPTAQTEKSQRSTSWGLTQIMGQVARESGWSGRFLSELCDPEVNLRLALDLLEKRHRKFDGDQDWMILSWNRGPGCKKPAGTEAYLLSVKRWMNETPYHQPSSGVMPKSTTTGVPYLKVPHGLDEIVRTFGDPRLPNFERDHIVLFDLPYPLYYDGIRVTRSRCHKLLVGHFWYVLEKIQRLGLEEHALNYSGIYAPRSIRGASSRLSTHAWGIAIDLEAQKYPLGSSKRLPETIVDIFKEVGFFYGGDFSGRKDPMHFQYCTGY